jgi:hypothetical protein
VVGDSGVVVSPTTQSHQGSSRLSISTTAQPATGSAGLSRRLGGAVTTPNVNDKLASSATLAAGIGREVAEIDWERRAPTAGAGHRLQTLMTTTTGRSLSVASETASLTAQPTPLSTRVGRSVAPARAAVASLGGVLAVETASCLEFL